jgi:hypothetical protein
MNPKSTETWLKKSFAKQIDLIFRGAFQSHSIAFHQNATYE